MKIDMSKVNLTERDIEDWLYENPHAVVLSGAYPLTRVQRWLARQYSLPSRVDEPKDKYDELMESINADDKLGKDFDE